MAKNLNGQNVECCGSILPTNMTFSFVSLLIKNMIIMNIKQRKISDYSNHNID